MHPQYWSTARPASKEIIFTRSCRNRQIELRPVVCPKNLPPSPQRKFKHAARGGFDSPALR
jgi:hypothetical protein